MEEYENLYDKICEIIGTSPRDLNILEDSIDVDLQVEYFEFSKKTSQELSEDWAMDHVHMLEDSDYSIDCKKRLLTRLATIEQLDAFKAIESYTRHPDKELDQWGKLALEESKMHLKSNLLEENQVIISTGLGGKENKLRYFVVLIARNQNELTDFQKKIISKEFPYTINNYQGAIEEFDASGYLAAFMLLLPIQFSVRTVFEEGIEACNQFGDFLEEDCIITNVKRLTFKEVTDFLEKE